MTKLYVMIPMLEDFQVSREAIINHEQMLEYVYSYNHGLLGHSDAWFELCSFDLNSEEESKKLNVSDYYSETDKYINSK